MLNDIYEEEEKKRLLHILLLVSNVLNTKKDLLGRRMIQLIN